MKTLVVSLLLILFSVGIAYARSPNPANAVTNCQNRCGESAKNCSKACNNPRSTKSEIVKCIQDCHKQAAHCHVQCTLVLQEHAKEYAYCIRQAKTEKQRQACIKAYQEQRKND